MGFKSWLKRATKIPKTGRGIIGNLVKNLAPITALTPLGVLGAGVLGAAGEGIRNKNAKFGDVLRAGVTNAGIGAGAKSLATKFGVLGQSAPKVATETIKLSGDIPGVSVIGGPSGPVTPGATIEALGSNPPTHGILNTVSRAGGKALKFADDHPMAASMALGAVGDLATADSQNRLRNAQAENLEQQAGETRYDFERRKRRAEQMAPMWSALGSGFQPSSTRIAPNPYLPS